MFQGTWVARKTATMLERLMVLQNLAAFSFCLEEPVFQTARRLT